MGRRLQNHDVRTSVAADRLWTVAYFSRLAGDLSRAELLSMAMHAQAKNEVFGVTGVLFYCRDIFIQIIEGERTAVTNLYDEIAEDTRHTQVVTLLDAPISRRSFEGWFMRLINLDDLRSREHGIVSRALESAGAWDDDRTIVGPTIELMACPGALMSGVIRTRPPDWNLSRSIN